jgi:hypothetical protein
MSDFSTPIALKKSANESVCLSHSLSRTSVQTPKRDKDGLKCQDSLQIMSRTIASQKSTVTNKGPAPKQQPLVNPKSVAVLENKL